MVKLNKIYTRTGDDGTTGLVRGPRRRKDDLRIECFGTVDEANGFVGQARLHTGTMPKLDRVLERIQNDLFDLGSDLATPGEDPEGGTRSLRITPSQTEWLEQQIDYYNEGLQPLKSFVLPGGTPPDVAAAVGKTLREAIAHPDLKAPAEKAGLTLQASSADDMAKLIQSQIGAFAQAVKQAKVPLEN